MKRINKHWFGSSKESIELDSMVDYSMDTFRGNIEKTMSMLELSGIDDAYYVDLTRSIGIPVVRSIIPGMELYSVDSSRVGKRLIPDKYVIN
jgi:ribosomal protein S12 methylthiotransferase accessory factor